ncbi:unnamed protein product [Didymodactylos carnosus]|uniref:Uncharacterized protein n=1 Tax=Didymodactylos carnosus TaxID=1234261 RepID=A0A8S2E4I1_9BILA|nr:unnamed protein product [Didymodactylos carnosus]CAF3896820.1 unnamed protein product [Didymodactylos carnosus]
MTFLVASGELGQCFINQINDLRNSRQIFVYCRNKHYHEEWTEFYINSKVKRIHTELHELIDDLKLSVNDYLEHEKDGVFNEIARKKNTTDAIDRFH